MVHDILSWCAIHLLSGVSTLGASRRLQEFPSYRPIQFPGELGTCTT